MLLKWLETDEMGETRIREGNPVNTRNAHEYARRNCRRCYGRGYLDFDSGSYHCNRINQRFEACGCVINNLQRIENAKRS